MWVGIFSELSGVGGVQHVSRHAGAVLQKLALARNQPCELLGLNDPRGTGSFQVGEDRYLFRGFARGKLELGAYLLRIAARVQMAYIGHAHLAPLGLLLRLVRRRSRYWVAAHGVEVWLPLSPLRRLALRGARGITCVSAFTAEKTSEAQGLDRRKMVLLPPALDPDFEAPFSWGTCLPLPPNTCTILTVSRLLSSEPGKGVDTVIRALPRLLGIFPNLYYAVVGSGDARPKLEALAQESQVLGRVVFVGEQSMPALKAYYRKADVFVMPSRQEGFGVVFLEAMAFAKPIIAASHGGAPEIVQDGLTGFLVGYGDVDALVERLTQLLGNERLRTQMGEAGRCRVREHYRFDQFRHELERILEAGS